MIYSRSLISSALFVCLLASAVRADNRDRRTLADKYAPAGIMGDHIHARGEWMVELKYMNMHIEDNKVGDKKVSDQQALAVPPTSPPPGPGVVVDGIRTNRGATPTQMSMDMYMAHIMYGASDDVTLYTILMLPSLTMDHARPDLTGFTTHNSGFGDTAFGALLRLMSDCDEDLILNLGCSVPTGDIYRETTAPSGGTSFQPLTYPMRLGSGTFNFRPGLTYKKYCDGWSWGAQFQTDLPIGRNYRGYRVGEEFRFNSWTSVLLTESISVSYRGEHLFRNNYDGTDPATPDALTSTNVEEFRGGYWYSMGFGAQALVKDSVLSVEIVPTLHQDLEGIQLETDYALFARWSKAW